MSCKCSNAVWIWNIIAQLFLVSSVLQFGGGAAPMMPTPAASAFSGGPLSAPLQQGAPALPMLMERPERATTMAPQHTNLHTTQVTHVTVQAKPLHMQSQCTGFQLASPVVTANINDIVQPLQMRTCCQDQQHADRMLPSVTRS